MKKIIYDIFHIINPFKGKVLIDDAFVAEKVAPVLESLFASLAGLGLKMKNPETEAISGFCCKLHFHLAEKEGLLAALAITSSVLAQASLARTSINKNPHLRGEVFFIWRRKRDSNPRNRGYSSTVFKTAAFDRSAISPPQS